MEGNLKKTYEAMLKIIAQNADIEMPSIHDIAKKLHVRRDTIIRAMHQLQEDGFIKLRERQRALIIRPTNHSHAPEGISASAQKLAQLIKTDIMHGLLQPGHRLPKYSYYASEYHVSQNSVRDAIKALHQDGLIFRKGKGWLVGSLKQKKEQKHIEVVGARGVMFVIYRDSIHWRDDFLYTDNPVALLGNTAMVDLENNGIQLRQIFRERTVLSSKLPCLTTVENIDQLLDELGDRYRGAIISVEKWNDAKPIIDRLAKTKRPIACFHNLPPNFDQFKGTRISFYQRSVPHAVTMALKVLTENGHKTIGHPIFPDHEPAWEALWMNDRSKQIIDTAKNMHPSPKIIPHMMSEPFWLDSKWRNNEEEFSEYIDMLLKQQTAPPPNRSSGGIRSRREALATIAPSLAQLVNQPGITAIIAHNDRIARLYVICLLAAGIDVPNDISIVSFDNDTAARLWSQTTIDMGLEPLGHQMARELLGDSKIRVSSLPVVHAHPRLIFRNSLKKIGRAR